ncbi:glutathione S-transferase family protein [Sporobolomyces koalae]|uniref:glutathione S-transferase family protein n=1 Tax=Sporobolomyces koalae TaxID=500713 RepID=UPI003180BB21
MALRLYTSNASPFCLKIMVLLHELKMTRQVALDYSVKAFPTFQSTAHSHLAPLGKIPALAVQVDSEEVPRVLFGSQVIAQYLDSLARDKALPAAGLERFEALATESLADGICEAALSLRYERLERASSHFARQIVLPAELLWADWVSGQLSKITRAIPLLSKKATQIDPLSETLPLAGVG